MSRAPNGEIRVLHVDDEPDVLDLTRAYLERDSSAFVVVGETSAEAALDRLETEAVDCIVSDYEMPGLDGLKFLEAVRERRPKMPFILFTGQGSEAVASAAISAGLTDYMQKGTDASQYDVLANRIRNAVGNYRTQTRHDRHLRAIETAREGIALLDDDTRFTYVNRAYADLYGYEPDEMVGENWALIYPDEDDGTREDILRAVRREGRWRGQTVGLRVDGETFVEDHSLARTTDGGLVCIVSEGSPDGEPDRIAEDFELLLENAADMIHFVDHEGVIRYANPATTTLTGYDREELVGSHVSLLMGDEDLETAREFVRERLSEWPDVRSAEFSWTLHTADGDAFLCDSNVRPLFVEGEWRGLIGVVRDVSDRTKREQVLEERNRAIERQNEQLETLASVVSHDLRNPLNVATGRLQLAREEHESEHLAALDDSLARVEEIIEGTMALARGWRTVEESSPIELAPFVSESWRNVATGEATLHVEEDLVIRADERRLQNVFENLLGNAVEHGGHGVSVRVGALADGFYVEDDGTGIPDAELGQVFEAGYSTRSEGTGLGLHIVAAITNAHGWDVTACSTDGGGARFEVTGVELVTD